MTSTRFCVKKSEGFYSGFFLENICAGHGLNSKKGNLIPSEPVSYVPLDKPFATGVPIVQIIDLFQIKFGILFSNYNLAPYGRQDEKIFLYLNGC